MPYVCSGSQKAIPPWQTDRRKVDAFENEFNVTINVVRVPHQAHDSGQCVGVLSANTWKNMRAHHAFEAGNAV